MLYTLVLVICFAETPDACETREQIVDGLGPHPSIAFVQVQTLVARWLAAHPRYRIQRFALRPGSGA